jgi:hypothetical protein
MRLRAMLIAVLLVFVVASIAAATAQRAANPGASCIGQDLSFAATSFHEGVGDQLSSAPQTNGAAISAVAQTHTTCG